MASAIKSSTVLIEGKSEEKVSKVATAKTPVSLPTAVMLCAFEYLQNSLPDLANSQASSYQWAHTVQVSKTINKKYTVVEAWVHLARTIDRMKFTDSQKRAEIFIGMGPKGYNGLRRIYQEMLKEMYDYKRGFLKELQKMRTSTRGVTVIIHPKCKMYLIDKFITDEAEAIWSGFTNSSSEERVKRAVNHHFFTLNVLTPYQHYKAYLAITKDLNQKLVDMREQVFSVQSHLFDIGGEE